MHEAVLILPLRSYEQEQVYFNIQLWGEKLFQD